MMTYRAGDQVLVQPDETDRSPAWVGEIVSYWRNDCWIVREPVHGTTCAYSVQRLSRARKALTAQELAPQRATSKVSCLGCDKLINPKFTLCGSCAEDMGYARRPR